MCKPCSSPCKTCEENATNCHSCEGGLVLDQGTCQETCSERHVAVEGVCKRCPEMCQECLHEKTCKGTWEHPRGKHGSTKPPQLGANYLRAGCPSRTGGTSLPSLSEVCLPLCMALRKVRVRSSLSIMDPASLDRREHLLHDFFHTRVLSTEGMPTLSQVKPVAVLHSTVNSNSNTLAKIFFFWNYPPRKANFLFRVRQTHVIGAILSKEFSWHNLKCFFKIREQTQSQNAFFILIKHVYFSALPYQ